MQNKNKTEKLVTLIIFLIIAGIFAGYATYRYSYAKGQADAYHDQYQTTRTPEVLPG